MYIEKLIAELESGKDIQKIVSDRLDYLNSESYQSNKIHIVTKFSNLVILWEGFIPTTQKVANTDLLNPSYLVPGSNKVYEDFVLALKNYIDNGTDIKHKYPIRYAKKFFEKTENEYSDIINLYKECGYNRAELREELQAFISEYSVAKKYVNNIDSFSDIYNFQYFITPEDIKTNKEYKLFKEVYKSITEGKEQGIPLDELKGTGVINMCTEYAMFYQNLSSFLGYETIMAGGNLKNEGHNYNFVYDNGQWMLHDLVNGKDGYVNYKLGKDFTEEDIVDVIFGDKKIELANENNLVYEKNDGIIGKQSDVLLEEDQMKDVSTQLQENKGRSL